MTRPTRRRLAEEIDDLGDGPGDDATLEVVIRRDAVGEDGDIVERKETVVEIG